MSGLTPDTPATPVAGLAPMKRRCAAEPGCDGTPPPDDLACDRHPACAECDGRIMHDIRCRTARAERLAAHAAQSPQPVPEDLFVQAARVYVELFFHGSASRVTAGHLETSVRMWTSYLPLRAALELAYRAGLAAALPSPVAVVAEDVATCPRCGDPDPMNWHGQGEHCEFGREGYADWGAQGIDVVATYSRVVGEAARVGEDRTL